MHKIKVKPKIISRGEELEIFKKEKNDKMDKTFNNLLKDKDNETLKKIYEHYEKSLIELNKKLFNM